jgi:MFS family permease
LETESESKICLVQQSKTPISDRSALILDISESGSLMGAINSYPQYREYFNFPRDGGTPSTGIVYAIYTIGNLVGSFAAGPATDFRGEKRQSNHNCSIVNKILLGRRVGMFIGGLVIILGTCVQATAHNLAAFMIGRFILGFGVAICASAGPAYVSEMAHPSFRGMMTGM